MKARVVTGCGVNIDREVIYILQKQPLNSMLPSSHLTYYYYYKEPRPPLRKTVYGKYDAIRSRQPSAEPCTHRKAKSSSPVHYARRIPSLQSASCPTQSISFYPSPSLYHDPYNPSPLSHHPFHVPSLSYNSRHPSLPSSHPFSPFPFDTHWP